MRCGIVHENPIGHFYKNQWSELYIKNDKFTPLCKKCVNEIFDSLSRRYKSDKTACILMCHMLDFPYSHVLFDSITKSNNIFSMGLFARQLNNKQNQFRTFNQTILEGELNKTEDEIKANKETKWKSADIKNKNYVIQTVGYDCFEDESYTDENRKFLFNTLADYLTDDTIEDPHKLQCVIAMVKTTLQVDNIDKLINMEFRSKNPNNNLIKSYSDIKDKLSRNINSAANENGISAKTSGKTNKGANALTNIMKEMSENGFDDIKVNIVDVKMNGAYKSIADISNMSLLNQLNYQSDDFARMVAIQRETMKEFEDKIILLEEENRLLKIENKNIKLNQEGVVK